MDNPDLPDKYCTEGPYIYDDGAFTIWLTRFGMWRSADREGNGICSSIDKDACVTWSREHVNGYPNSWTSDSGIYFKDLYKL